MNYGSFPDVRLRRNRSQPWVRELVAENHLQAGDLIMPFFAIEGKNKKEAVPSMPDIYRLSIDLLVKEVEKAKELGIKAIMLFAGADPKLKDESGSEAYNENNLICRTISAIKKDVPKIGIICDVALDPYTSHGHDGILSKDKGDVLNDATVAVLCKQALVQAKAGCDMISPSDMMDGRVGQIREYLDQNGYENVGIMSYGAKYASGFYGPFREAVGSLSNLAKANKKSYQMDFRNSDEAIREIALDVEEGADMIIIKPGLPYLDIVLRVKQSFNIPVISYHVSGEYAMLKLAEKENLVDFDQSLYETLIAFKRAGTSAIITYGAMRMAQILKNNAN